MSMTLLSWNVAGRVQRQPEQAERIVELGPDLVCLQEVTPRTAPVWTSSLHDHGWDLVKVRTHEALHAHLAAGHGPRALCGDLNTPRREQPDGRVCTFARTRDGKLRPERGERWDRAELALIKGLEPYGFRDAFRDLHGYERREPTWEWRRWGGGYRLDHLIVSSEVDVPRIEYLHDWRRQAALSDHSPLLATLDW